MGAKRCAPEKRLKLANTRGIQENALVLASGDYFLSPLSLLLLQKIPLEK